MTWNLLGHTWAEDLLKQHIANDEVRHAYLFTGAPGVGRRSLALEFACAVNCTQPPAPGEFCGQCRTCTQILSSQHPDLSIIRSEGDTQTIKVDQVRALQHSLSLAPYSAKYRVALLRDFQQANANAQNALLKTLEEAPRQVILLLTADSAENLLPTISSRCEIIRLRPVSVETLTTALNQRWQIPAAQADLYAHLANGRAGTALQYSAHPELLEQRTALLDDFVRLLGQLKRDRFTYSDTLSKSRDGARMALQTWYNYARDLLLLTNQPDAVITNLDRAEELDNLVEQLSPTRALKIVKAIDNALTNLEASGHLRLLMDCLFLELPRI
jgi:DNA polymerase-3 subunit delta'